MHGYYWDDDQPMLYFQDVRDNPSYCASHVVPLEELNGDLAHADTTPNYAWVAPDDCSDMEGCGIAAGDAFPSAFAFTYPTTITLSGDTAIVIEPYGDSISLIDTRTNHVYAPIPVGAFPGAVTVTG